MNKEQKKQLKSWGVDPKSLKSKNNKWLGFTLIGVIGLMLGATLFGLFIQADGTSQFLSDTRCEEMINASSNYAVSYGMEYAIASITQEAVQCNQIPMEYGNYTYTLIAAECLSLNNSEAK